MLPSYPAVLGTLRPKVLHDQRLVTVIKSTTLMNGLLIRSGLGLLPKVGRVTGNQAADWSGSKIFNRTSITLA